MNTGDLVVKFLKSIIFVAVAVIVNIFISASLVFFSDEGEFFTYILIIAVMMFLASHIGSQLSHKYILLSVFFVIPIYAFLHTIFSFSFFSFRTAEGWYALSNMLAAIFSYFWIAVFMHVDVRKRERKQKELW